MKYEKKPLTERSAAFLYLFKGEVLKLKLVTHIHIPGKQGDGYFGDDAGVVVFDVCIVTTDINNGTEHNMTP